MKKWWSMVCFFGIVMLMLCSQQGPLGAAPVPGDDIQVIKNKGTSLQLAKQQKILLNPQLSLGVQEGSESVMFHKPMEVIADKAGNIYVLDSGNSRIQKFDSKGKFLLSIGRKGEGPGEIAQCSDIDVDAKGNLTVFDWRLQRVSRFDDKGKLLNSFKSGLPARYGVVDSKGNIYLYNLKNEKLIHKFSPEGKPLGSFLDAVKSPQERTRIHVNSLGRIAIDKKDNIYLVLTYPYAVYVINTEGKLLKKILSDTDYALPPHITSNQNVITNFMIIGFDISPKGYILCRNIHFKVPEKLDGPTIKKLFGALYQEHTYLDVFSPEGKLLSHHRMKGFSWGGFFDEKGDYLGIEEGDDFFKASKYSVTLKK